MMNQHLSCLCWLSSEASALAGCMAAVAGIQLLQPFRVPCHHKAAEELAETGIQPTWGCNSPLEIGELVARAYKRTSV